MYFFRSKKVKVGHAGWPEREKRDRWPGNEVKELKYCGKQTLKDMKLWVVNGNVNGNVRLNPFQFWTQSYALVCIKRISEWESNRKSIIVSSPLWSFWGQITGKNHKTSLYILALESHSSNTIHGFVYDLNVKTFKEFIFNQDSSSSWTLWGFHMFVSVVSKPRMITANTLSPDKCLSFS